MDSNISIGLVVSSEILREGLCHILANRHFRVDASVSSAAGLRAGLATGQDPQIVLVSLGTADNVSDICSAVKQACPTSKIVLTARDFAMEDIVKAFQLDVCGLILSSASCDLIDGSLRLVALGELVLPGKMADYLVRRHHYSDRFEPEQEQAQAGTCGLSHREIDILKNLVSGHANKVIARRLDITEATVKVHMKTILRKLHLENRTQAAIWATKNNVNGTASTSQPNLMAVASG
jgi:two-component system nitrate/nitrite response regulator NarL